MNLKTYSDLAKNLDISLECALDVVYLRTRQRHTDALEAELIELHKQGKPPNIQEFGCTIETGKTLAERAHKGICYEL